MQAELYDQIYEIEKTHWWYVARRKIIFDWVLRTLADYPTPYVLDIGCGTGFNIEYLHHHNYGQVVGLDFSKSALSFCLSRHLTNLSCADGICPPLRTASFDLIMALDLIEHLENDTEALQALARLLKPGGSLIIFTPAFNFLWGKQDEVSHHFRRYTASELRHKLRQADLAINKLTYANTFLFPLVWGGRMVMRVFGDRIHSISENDLHPGWSNSLLQAIFAAEAPLLRYIDFPVGVSLFCIARKPIH